MVTGGRAMSETRKIAAILVADVVGYSRLAGADEDRILARLRALRSDLIDPTIAVHHGRVVKPTGEGSTIALTNFGEARKSCRKQNRRWGRAGQLGSSVRVSIFEGGQFQQGDCHAKGTTEGKSASRLRHRSVRGRRSRGSTNLCREQFRLRIVPARRSADCRQFGSISASCDLARVQPLRPSDVRRNLRFGRNCE